MGLEGEGSLEWRTVGRRACCRDEPNKGRERGREREGLVVGCWFFGTHSGGRQNRDKEIGKKTRLLCHWTYLGPLRNLMRKGRPTANF